MFNLGKAQDIAQLGNAWKKAEEVFAKAITDDVTPLFEKLKSDPNVQAPFVVDPLNGLPPHIGCTIKLGIEEFHLIMKHVLVGRSEILLLHSEVDVMTEAKKIVRKIIGRWTVDGHGNYFWYDQSNQAREVMQGIGQEVLKALHKALIEAPQKSSAGS